ncbi:MAG: inositol monophosphatase family protein [Brevinematales bacterium]|jgi:myo-inositol-1(or 4)-monophosphatase
MGQREQYLDFAFSCAERAGNIIKKGFHSEKDVFFKSFANPVTQYDKASEALITGMIDKKYPRHSILTEEGLSRENDASIKWIIDPIDGTVNFTHRIPFVSVSIGLEIDKEIVLGVVYNPMLGEWFWAVKGQGAFFNRKMMHVSGVKDPGKSLIVTGFPYESAGRVEFLMKPLVKISNNFTGFRRLGSASIDMCYVARGSFEGFYEENLKPWDTAAGKVIVEEAGGTLSDYSGKSYDIYKKTIIADNGLIHGDILNLLEDIPTP